MRRRAIEIPNFFEPTRAHLSLPPRNSGVILIPPKAYNSAEPTDEFEENPIAPALGTCAGFRRHNLCRQASVSRATAYCVTPHPSAPREFESRRSVSENSTV
jgi:hypothetical protein